MKRTRQVLVMTLVATALCADRLVVTEPAVRASLTSPSADPLARLATNLGRRFSRSLCRASASTCVRLHQERRDQRPTTPAIRPAPQAPTPAVAYAAQGSPFEFRLPPPT